MPSLSGYGKGPPASMSARVSRASAGRSATAIVPPRSPEEDDGADPSWRYQVRAASTTTTTRPSAVRRVVAGTGDVLEGHGLGAALDLGTAVLAQRVDRPAGQVVVEEQPGDDLAVVVPVVVHQGQQARESLHD